MHRNPKHLNFISLVIIVLLDLILLYAIHMYVKHIHHSFILFIRQCAQNKHHSRPLLIQFELGLNYTILLQAQPKLKLKESFP
jgi:hypothetical protein